jgi:transposase
MTDEQIDYIHTEFSKKVKVSHIADKIGMHRNAIYLHLKKNGYEVPLKKLTVKEKEFIISNYDGYNVKEIAHSLKRPKQTIYNFLENKTKLKSSVDIAREQRKLLKEKFDGYNHKELANEFGVSMSLIRNWITKIKISKRNVNY